MIFLVTANIRNYCGIDFNKIYVKRFLETLRVYSFLSVDIKWFT